MNLPRLIIGRFVPPDDPHDGSNDAANDSTD
jgi:hypothetical protein